MSSRPTRRTTPTLPIAVLTLLVSQSLPAQPPPDLPRFDTSNLEPAVAEQLDNLTEHVEAVLASDAASSAKAEAIGELGRHYHAYQLVEPAEECFRLAADLAPRDFRWRYHLAYLQQQTGRLEEAAAGYERSLGIVPDVRPALTRLGQVYKELDRPEAAAEVLERVVESDPSASAAFALLGEVRLSQRRYREAVALLERALELQSDANLLYYPLALAYRGLGEEEEARRLLALRGKVGVRPADPLIDGMARLTTGERVHLLRGRRAFAAGRWAEAVAEFEGAVAANPESIPGWINLGTARAASGEIEPAIRSYRRAIELGPGNATARFNLGQLFARLGRLGEAREELRGAASYAPTDAAIHYELAEVLSRMERFGEALLHYRLAIEHAPPGEAARLGEARALIALARWEEAVKRLEEAYAAVPTSGPVAYALARFLAASPRADLRDGERALDLARRVYDAGPTPSRAELVAEALAESGRCDEAAEWERQVLAALGDGAPEPDLRRVRTRLTHYSAGAPCRPPVESAPSQ